MIGIRSVEMTHVCRYAVCSPFLLLIASHDVTIVHGYGTNVDLDRLSKIKITKQLGINNSQIVLIHMTIREHSVDI